MSMVTWTRHTFYDFMLVCRHLINVKTNVNQKHHAFEKVFLITILQPNVLTVVYSFYTFHAKLISNSTCMCL